MVKEKNHKVSKKGIGITAGILISLTVGSFAIYIMPEDTGMRIVVTDFSSHLCVKLSEIQQNYVKMFFGLPTSHQL